jgi:futalosine hydrolase
MNCLLAAATPLEIAPFLQQLRKGKLPTAINIDVLVTGIGLTATTYSIVKQLQLKKPDLVVQAGVAGCFDKKMALGTVVAVERETIADQSVIELRQLKTLFDLKLLPLNQFPFKRGWLVNPGRNLLKATRLPKVNAISVNEITTSRQKIKFYEQAFNPVVESMEGAALHYTCLMENVPFLQLRSLSNYIGERNKKKWNMKESVQQLNHVLIRILENL